MNRRRFITALLGGSAMTQVLTPGSSSEELEDLRRRVAALEAAARSPQSVLIRGNLEVVGTLKVDSLSQMYTVFVDGQGNIFAQEIGLSIAPESYVQIGPCTTSPGPAGITHTGNLYVDSTGRLRYVGNSGTDTIIAPA